MRLLQLITLLATLAAADHNAYVPTKSKDACPNGPLVRSSADGALSAGEAAYMAQRKPKADAALRAWVDAQWQGLGSGAATVPTVALSCSGGGWRALTTGAGVIKALDGREQPAVAVSGLLQALSYQVGVSGGAWLTSALAGNNWPTVTSMREGLWHRNLKEGLLHPPGWDPVMYAKIFKGILGKSKAGYPISIVDLWSRLLSYQLLGGDDGGSATTLSSVLKTTSMTAYSAPFPMLYMNGVSTADGKCDATDASIMWEANPFEFGTWDDGVAAWVPMQNLGTRAGDTECTVGFDNLGFMFGASSNLFAFKGCYETEAKQMTGLMELVEKIGKDLHAFTEISMFSRVPNPFQGIKGKSKEAEQVEKQDELMLVDGGLADRMTPITGLLEKARGVSVIFLVDSTADDKDTSLPNGNQLVHMRETVKGMNRIRDRMPTIPDVEVFVRQGFNKKGVILGCDEREAVTIVYLPNNNITFQSGVETTKYEYPPDFTEGMINNGEAIATKNGDHDWGKCLACAMMNKEQGVVLPEGCKTCLDTWCYRANGGNQ